MKILTRLLECEEKIQKKHERKFTLETEHFLKKKKKKKIKIRIKQNFELKKN